MQPSITTPLLREVINLDIHPSRQAEEALNNRVDAWITELFDVSVGNAVTAGCAQKSCVGGGGGYNWQRGVLSPNQWSC
jgi:hypothetical protein